MQFNNLSYLTYGALAFTGIALAITTVYETSGDSTENPAPEPTAESSSDTPISDMFSGDKQEEGSGMFGSDAAPAEGDSGMFGSEAPSAEGENEGEGMLGIGGKKKKRRTKKQGGNKKSVKKSRKTKRRKSKKEKKSKH